MIGHPIYMKLNPETENLELVTRVWRIKVERLVCMIEELLPLAALSACMPPDSRRRTFDEGAKLVGQYRKSNPKHSEPITSNAAPQS